MKVTIKEIAELSGVSVTTVSQIMNNKGGRFSEKTRNKVLKVIEENEYAPNYFASNIILKKSKTIGVIAPSASEQFTSGILKVLRDALQKSGYYLIICESDHQQERETALLKKLNQLGVEAIVFFTANRYSQEVIQQGKYLKTPVLFVDRGLNQGYYGSILVQEEAGAYQATQWLIQRGNQRIAILTDNATTYQLNERFLGYQRALEEAGISFSEELVCKIPLTIEGGYTGTEQLMQMPSAATAIFCVDDMVALGCYQAVYDLGKRLYQEIDIVGFDGGEITDLVRPRIRTVRQPLTQFGILLAEKIKKVTQYPNERIGDVLLDTVFEEQP
ncbi:LacI family transcriptional regulator [Enterococcus florum]|uniref:LacI family transcriptional regulator n=1 Tax=Enterococcus florum TaxID=2480627 RepID=A0A4P5P432_9ENTE|nr:LacI family DNA-binding transcriptional regulator [Enterococcus florum]GCF92537.1 LacI family transcriptional regulator [Enterococcus florum]